MISRWPYGSANRHTVSSSPDYITLIYGAFVSHQLQLANCTPGTLAKMH